MGLDGGTIITRSDVLRGTSWRLSQQNAESRSTRGGAVSTSSTYKEPSLDRQAAWRIKWRTCALSEQPLAAPIVADRLGSLYNRESVLEWILARRGAAADASAVHRFANQIRTNGGARAHLASLKDVFAVDLAAAGRPAGSGGGSGGPAGAAPAASTSGQAAAAAAAGDGAEGPAYACPVTGLPAGRYTMVALVPCGHVVSQRALEEVKSSEAACPMCGKRYAPGSDDVIINGTEEQVAELRARMRGGGGKGGGGGKRKHKEAKQGGAAAGGEPARAAEAASAGGGAAGGAPAEDGTIPGPSQGAEDKAPPAQKEAAREQQKHSSARGAGTAEAAAVPRSRNEDAQHQHKRVRIAVPE